MLRFTWPAGIALWVLMVVNGFAQSPAPSTASPAASSAPAPAKSSPTPTPSATPTTEDLINSLGEADLQAIITLLKNNFTNPDAITETELNRATIEGLMIRLSYGIMFLPPPSRGEAAPIESSGAFYSEILDGHAGYLRLGAFTTANLQALDKKLGEFSGKKVDALIIDLRDSPPTNDFGTAAEVAKRFCPKGKPLFTLRKPAARQDRVFTSDREPTFQGLIMVLADGDTVGGAETLAGALRFYNKALIIGQPTAGRAVEYSDLQLPSGKVLRVAVAEAVLPEGRATFPDRVKPDLPVGMSMAEKRQIFQLSAQEGMGPFVYETERPHLNEAALLAGTNPELDAAEAAQERRRHPAEKPAAYDPVLQRALDVVTSLEIYQKR